MRLACAAGGLHIDNTEATPKLVVLDSVYRFDLRFSSGRDRGLWCGGGGPPGGDGEGEATGPVAVTVRDMRRRTKEMGRDANEME